MLLPLIQEYISSFLISFNEFIKTCDKPCKHSRFHVVRYWRTNANLDKTPNYKPIAIKN